MQHRLPCSNMYTYINQVIAASNKNPVAYFPHLWYITKDRTFCHADCWCLKHLRVYSIICPYMLQLMDMFRTVADDRHSFHIVTSATLHPCRPSPHTLCTARDDVQWPCSPFHKISVSLRWEVLQAIFLSSVVDQFKLWGDVPGGKF